jgi:hypothetical protein
MLWPCPAGDIFQALDNHFILCDTLLGKKEVLSLMVADGITMKIPMRIQDRDQPLTQVMAFLMVVGFNQG